jgi:hypothetical protein
MRIEDVEGAARTAKERGALFRKVPQLRQNLEAPQQSKD